MGTQQQFYRSQIWFLGIDRFKGACSNSSSGCYTSRVWRVSALVQSARITWTTNTWTTQSHDTPRGREESSMQKDLLNVRKRVTHTTGIHWWTIKKRNHQSIEITSKTWSSVYTKERWKFMIMCGLLTIEHHYNKKSTSATMNWQDAGSHLRSKIVHKAWHHRCILPIINC